MAQTNDPGETAAERERVTELHEPPPKGEHVVPEEGTEVQVPAVEEGADTVVRKLLLLLLLIALNNVIKNSERISPTQSKAPDAAGNMNASETATLRTENDAATETVKLRGVTEDVVAVGATTAALAMPGERITWRKTFELGVKITNDNAGKFKLCSISYRSQHIHR
jgi:hypothetical protein